MTISLDKLSTRREELVKNYEELTKNIIEGEKQIINLKDQRNAMGGALQQVEMFIKDCLLYTSPSPRDH